MVGASGGRPLGAAVIVSKLNLAIVAVLATGLLWIEHQHRIFIGTPAAAEAAPPASSVCPATDDVPFSAACIKFIDGGTLPDLRKHVGVVAPVPDGHGLAEPQGPACPDSNENAPYSAKCIKFLSGWFWQANPTTDTP